MNINLNNFPPSLPNIKRATSNDSQEELNVNELCSRCLCQSPLRIHSSRSTYTPFMQNGDLDRRSRFIGVLESHKGSVASRDSLVSLKESLHVFYDLCKDLPEFIALKDALSNSSYDDVKDLQGKIQDLILALNSLEEEVFFRVRSSSAAPFKSIDDVFRRTTLGSLAEDLSIEEFNEE